MRQGNYPYSVMHLTNFLQLFPTYYWVLILMVIADTCEYCVQFITTSNYVHSAHGCYKRLTSSSAWVIVGFWLLVFPPCWFPSASHSLVLGLEAAVSCDPSGRAPALPQQCQQRCAELPAAPWGSEQSWLQSFWRRSYHFSKNCGPHSVH